MGTCKQYRHVIHISKTKQQLCVTNISDTFTRKNIVLNSLGLDKEKLTGAGLEPLTSALMY